MLLDLIVEQEVLNDVDILWSSLLFLVLIKLLLLLLLLVFFFFFGDECESTQLHITSMNSQNLAFDIPLMVRPTKTTKERNERNGKKL